MFICYRVAKCGTRSILWILKKLSSNLGYELQFAKVREWNVQANNEDEIMSEINNIFKASKRSQVRARHFSFIDLKGRGFDWTPLWFGIIRDPIERVKKEIS